jgi:hypothetical protein
VMRLRVYVDMGELAEQVEGYLGRGCRGLGSERLRGREVAVRPE